MVVNAIYLLDKMTHTAHITKVYILYGFIEFGLQLSLGSIAVLQ